MSYCTPLKITSVNLLIVEGKDERLLFEALIAHERLSGIQVMDIGGKTKLKDNLLALVLTPGFRGVRCIGIVRDADHNPDGAFKSVCSALKSAKLAVPRVALQMQGQMPKVCVMIVPAANRTGALEDLCLNSVQTDSAMPCVNQYFECLEQLGVSLSSHRSKAMAQTFLASRKKEGLRLGEAAQAGYWPLDDSSFDDLRQILVQLA